MTKSNDSKSDKPDFGNEDDAINYVLAADLSDDERNKRATEVDTYEQKRVNDGASARERVRDALHAARTQPPQG